MNLDKLILNEMLSDYNLWGNFNKRSHERLNMH